MFDLRSFSLEHWEEIDSTNSEALRKIARGEVDRPLAISATSQTNGRGSRERVWASHSGNVHVTYLLPVLDARREAFLVVYPLALATSRTIREMTGLGSRVTLKWPNDVLIDGKKVSGALHEVGWLNGRAILAAGIGVNVGWSPRLADAVFPPTALSEVVHELPDCREIVTQLGAAILSEIASWLEKGFESVRERYHAESYLLNSRISIVDRVPGTTPVEGVYRGIDPEGALQLETESGISKHYSVDVFPSLATLS
ncbi:biotin--[acetyl-CoA-carboxylase] ligase [Sphingomonas sp.]|uniref:biotin--[acetyl-CoA-carboxylase] ligase n=1 Tax=Sphingomonas sp. TaxID=28214 RepID=UPI001B0E2F87|nr:biotin--[acetyl-CoA-carboxylase] ligase [Sphingomonas sp.]MBO9712165.1 biotin--[acetyl-CoA-carboxylase] ligase [Sphingomonas sp.]